MSGAAPGAAVAPAPWWRRARLVAPILLGAVIVVVVGARLARGLPAVQAFIEAYPGVAPLPADAPVGFPAWVAWQHGLNAVFLLFVLRSGWRIRASSRPGAARPSTFWTRRNTGRLATTTPPTRITIDVWSHFVGDTLWVLNGVVFVLLLFATGQWMRIVPTTWAIVPNAISAALQYASFAWPHADGWVNYNALQTLAYFVVVFVAAPVAVLTGLRAAPGFAARLRPLDRVFPVALAKRIHFWDLLIFAAFIVVHLALVLLTGAVRNLNHMYAVRDDESWAGVAVFLLSLAVMVGLVAALRPPVVRWFAARIGTVLHRPPRGSR